MWSAPLMLRYIVAGWVLSAVAAAAITPTPAPPSIRINIGNAVGAPGDSVQVTVSLDVSGASVAATVNDISFSAQALALDPTTCRVNSTIGKSINASVLSSDATSTTVRVLVQSSQNTAPIPSGPLYTCAFRIAAAALPGTYRLDNVLALVTTSDGATITGVPGANGAVSVSLIGHACSGDCDGDGTITIDELIVGVNIALGNRPVDDCLSLDPNGDGMVTINELIAAVGNAVNGCVTPPTPVPTATPTPTPVPIRLFVRAGGNDDNHGGDPANALRTITTAAKLAQSGYEIVVGPGTYVEGVTTASGGRAPQRLRFLADVSGSATGDAAGPVIVDATGSATGDGFKLSNSSGSGIDGFTITGGADAGIAIKSSTNDFTIRNCIIFNNPGAGIRVQDSEGITVFNNLIYGNGVQGLALVGSITGAPLARVFSNTMVSNGDRGITAGSTNAPSDHALIRNNILQDNGMRTTPALENIKVFVDSEPGYDEDFDLIFPFSYLPTRLAGQHDVFDDATFVFSSGADYHLRPGSPAIDAGTGLPLDLETILRGRTTTGNGVDTGVLDAGFHFLP
jgi:parallel beta-helix repeat protein